jgi:uncharacterized protein (UPF0332 family)
LKTEAAEYLAKARECLDAAKKIIAVGLPRVAAKEGYLSAYHAAHAFVFEKTGQVVKTHSGMRAVFARIAKDDPRVDRWFNSFLAQAYTFKEVADYGVGSQAVITVQEAQELIDGAERFVDSLARLLLPE